MQVKKSSTHAPHCCGDATGYWPVGVCPHDPTVPVLWMFSPTTGPVRPFQLAIRSVKRETTAKMRQGLFRLVSPMEISLNRP